MYGRHEDVRPRYLCEKGLLASQLSTVGPFRITSAMESPLPRSQPFVGGL